MPGSGLTGTHGLSLGLVHSGPRQDINMRKVAWPAGEPSATHRERWYAELTSERPQVRPLLRPQHPFDVQQYYGSRADATEHNARRVAQTRGDGGPAVPRGRSPSRHPPRCCDEDSPVPHAMTSGRREAGPVAPRSQSGARRPGSVRYLLVRVHEDVA
jgi:hypothetical protein